MLFVFKKKKKSFVLIFKISFQCIIIFLLFLLIQEMQVDFEAMPPCDSDYDGIRTLLNQVRTGKGSIYLLYSIT